MQRATQVLQRVHLHFALRAQEQQRESEGEQNARARGSQDAFGGCGFFVASVPRTRGEAKRRSYMVLVA
jgi:hypothetical protein